MDQPQPGRSSNYDARLLNKGDSSNLSERVPSNTRTQPPTPPYATDQNPYQSGASWHQEVSFQEPLPYYGHSPNSLSSPSTSSVEQSAPGELSQGFPVQNSFTPPILQENTFPGAYIWPQNDGDDLSPSFFGPAVTPSLSGAAPSTLKREREPDVPTQVLLPYPHKDWHLVPQSSGASYDRSNIVLCSRCNKYETLFGVPGLCSPCLQVSFNTWPSAIGTRNENLESLVLFLMPSHMEEVLSLAPRNMPRSRSWRMLPKQIQPIKNELDVEGFQYRWSFSKRLVRSTQLFSDNFEELANIAQLYQLYSPTKSKSLETCCTALIYVCELYNTIVGVPSSSQTPQTISIPKLISGIRAARTTVRHAFQQYQKLATYDSRDRQDWVPAFLTASILTVAAIIFLDITVACPPPYREQIWGEAWNERIVEMRNGGYGMLIGLLKANSGGVNPLKMECWAEEAPSAPPDPFINATAESYSTGGKSVDAGQRQHPPPKKKRKKSKAASQSAAAKSSARLDMERERNILLGFDSPAALQGMIALKEWNQKYSDILKQGEDLFSQSPFRMATTSPVASLWRIFELQ